MAVALAVSACGSGGDEAVAGAGDLGHIHDLVIDEDGRLLVASHTGLYRIDNVDQAVLVGSDRHDLMPMTSDGAALIASGHPDLRVEEYRVRDRPPFLGLARSTDSGKSWEVVDLLGDADFHALTTTETGLFAPETSGRIWHLDDNGVWSQRGEVAARDLAIKPDDPDQQLAPDYEGNVWVSADGAETWTAATDTPALIEIEWIDDDTIAGFTESATVWTAADSAGPWTKIATSPSLPGGDIEVETFYVDPLGEWWITVRGGSIFRSTNAGTSWDQACAPPEQA